MAHISPSPWMVGYGDYGVTGPRCAPSVYLDHSNVEKIPIRSGNQVVCWMLQSTSVRGGDMTADASLIAAAPDLLKAAKLAEVALWRGSHDITPEMHAALDSLKTAIAKAEGK